ncbi:PDR/VanB family oxidoreductase [Hydrogenophaga sp.]|uniref:PDR/VanB family oxidoreductase n=1 Tax=Hydrogenophaga sp. TaxID=1904254 RepID=UPI002601E3E4|nr:PDR/VanB family oxidoreductase [Hydrogenophaga sp.]MCW5652189.1 oxidoreductase [Hydrogenophaga sp.]
MSDRLSLRVVRREPLAGRIVALTLASADGNALPPFEAGAHIDVLTPSGHTRQYSLCNAPDTATQVYRIAVQEEAESRGGSRAMCRDVREGDLLEVGAPRNLFPLAPGTRRAILLAGGIGITPLLAMAHALHQAGIDFVLHHACRSRPAGAFVEELLAASFAERVRLHFDDEGPALDLAGVLADPCDGDHLYVCGPSGFIQWALDTARQLHWPDGQVHREFFAPAEPAVVAADGAFEVELAVSGKVLQVPADRSIASVLLAHGVPLAMSCEQGVCGTCVTTLLAGEADHRDSYLTDADRERGDTILPCCSRARSARLVLDL